MMNINALYVLHTDLNPMVVKLYRIKKTLKKREKIGK
jgi:hypothetical protein